MEKINNRTPEQIERILQWFNFDCSERECDSCPNEDICNLQNGNESVLARDALAYIERLKAERDAALAKVPKWISVKERPPEKGDKVLISLCGCNVKEAKYRGDGVFEAAYAETYHATETGSIVLTHWMTMPEPHEVSE